MKTKLRKVVEKLAKKFNQDKSYKIDVKVVFYDYPVWHSLTDFDEVRDVKFEGPYFNYVTICLDQSESEEITVIVKEALMNERGIYPTKPKRVKIDNLENFIITELITGIDKERVEFELNYPYSTMTGLRKGEEGNE